MAAGFGRFLMRNGGKIVYGTSFGLVTGKWFAGMG
jgi:hypothetical protein